MITRRDWAARLVMRPQTRVLCGHRARQAQRDVDDEQHRARAWALLDNHFAVPPPPAVGSGGGVGRWVVCDYDAVDLAVREMQQLATRAQANCDAARQARLRLQNNGAGSSADAAQTKLLEIEQTNRRFIVAITANTA